MAHLVDVNAACPSWDHRASTPLATHSQSAWSKHGHSGPYTVNASRTGDATAPYSLAPQGRIMRAEPRARRCSLDCSAVAQQQHSSSFLGQPRSNRQHVRQRRFSFAIGEKLPLMTIKEHQHQDVAASSGRDQAASFTEGSSMHHHAMQHHSQKRDRQDPTQHGSRSQQRRYSVRSPHYQVLQQGFGPGLQQTSVAAATSKDADTQDQQQPRDTAGFFAGIPARQSSNSSSSSSCEAATYFNPADGLDPTPSTGAGSAAAPPGRAGTKPHWPMLLQHMALQAQQLEPPAAHVSRRSHRSQVLLVHHPDMPAQHARPAGHFWQNPQHYEQQLQEPGPLIDPMQVHHQHRPVSGGSSHHYPALSRPSTAAMLQQLADRQLVCQAHQAAVDHRQALSALHVVEHEIEQLLRMQDWLVTARAVAASGTRAAEACESAVLQHEMVLQQALEAREALQIAALESATVFLRRGGGMHGAAAGAAEMYEGPTPMMEDGVESHFDFGSCREGFEDDEPLYPADAESLLQHFGHYPII